VHFDCYKTLAVAASSNSRCLLNDGESMLSGLFVPSIGSGALGVPFVIVGLVFGAVMPKPRRCY